jgi:hypothetical protein
MLGLTSAEVFDDFIQVAVMLFDVLVADSPNLLDDLIVVHGCDPPNYETASHLGIMPTPRGRGG